MVGRARASVVAGVLAVALLGGCGDDDVPEEGVEAQPAADEATFVAGDFGDIPLPPLAEPAGERSEIDGVVAQSYFVRNRTPADVLEFYVEQLAERGFEIVVPPDGSRDNRRGTWLVDGRELLVSATPAPTAEGGEVERSEVVTQLSLELAPEGGGGHDGDG